MPIGIGSPLPSGIPGFNQAGMYLVAGAGGGSVNANPLPSWYNIIRAAAADNDSVSLPPATCGGEPIVVANYTGATDPITGVVGDANNVTVFGSTNPYGIQDTIDNGSGVQVITGCVVPAGNVGIFYCTTPQGGYTNAWLPGRWIFKLLS